MYNIEKICCLCLEISGPLSDLFVIDQNGLTYFNKISVFLTRIVYVMAPNLKFKICNKCKETVDMIYVFNETSSKNLETLLSYNKVLKENDESVTLNYEEHEEFESNELVTVKIEPLLQDEAISDTEDNVGNFETVDVKDVVEDSSIYCEIMDPLPMNEFDFHIQIGEKCMKKEPFYEKSESESKLEKQNTRFGNKKRRKRKYEERSIADASDTMKKAVEIIINENYSLREASRLHKVPLTSLARYVSQYRSASDEEKKKMLYEYKYNTFSSKMEEQFKNYLLLISKIQNGLTKIECRQLAFVMAEKFKLKMPNAWKIKNMAGDMWLKRFSQRWPEIVFTKPDPTNLDRAKIFSKEKIREFFDYIVRIYS